MELEPVLAIYAGFSLDIFGYGGLGGTSYPEDRMGEVLQSALDELEYCMGNSSTYYGSLRAQHGHPDPFHIKYETPRTSSSTSLTEIASYIELGNEDWFSASYPYRVRLRKLDLAGRSNFYIVSNSVQWYKGGISGHHLDLNSLQRIFRSRSELDYRYTCGWYVGYSPLRGTNILLEEL